MRIYKKLWQHARSQELILFPTGVVCVPSALSAEYTADIANALKAKLALHFPTSRDPALVPLLVFEQLDETWTNTPPTQEEVLDKYIARLTDAVEVLTLAGVAHMDLRPENVMWRWDEERREVQMRLIDFEDARVFGDLVEFHRFYDARYPFPPDAGETEPFFKASDRCNQWFLRSVSAFVMSGLPPTERYRDFIANKMAEQAFADFYIEQY